MIITKLGSRLPAFRHRNFRRYALGQITSIGGTWLQNVALLWFTLELTDSEAAVGLVGAAQFFPALVFGAWAGTVADRFDSRRAVLALQVFLGAQALALAVLVLSDSAGLWSLVALALWQGVGSAFDPPVRQGLMNDLVGDAELPNAIATNSALVQLGLILGPALAAVLINTVGIGWCFAVNAASYAFMFLAIASLRTGEMHHRPWAEDADASVRAGLVHLRGRPDLRLLLGVMLSASLLAFRLEVLLPVLARDFGGGSGLFAAMTVMRGFGALLGSLYFAGRAGMPTLANLRAACALLAVSLAVMAIPHRAVVLVALVPAGLGLLACLVITLSMTQLRASHEFRGRMVALWFVVINGGTVVGSLLSGAVADTFGARSALGSGAMMMGLVAVVLTGRTRSDEALPLASLTERSREAGAIS